MFTMPAVLLFGSTLCNSHSKDRIYFLRVSLRNSFPYWMIRKALKKKKIFLGLCPKLWVGGGQES